MKKLLFRVLGVLSLTIAPLFVGGVANAVADTCIWTGGGANENFSNALNWSTCDNLNVPESGDTLQFPTSVDSDTLSDLDRVLNNDMTTMSFAGISVTGSYAVNDYDYYDISGNAITLTGSVVPSTDLRYLKLNTPLTLGANNLTIGRVLSTGSLAAGSNNVTLTNATFSGNITGSGVFTLSNNSGVSGGGGVCAFGTATPAPFSGNGSGFSGSIVISGYAGLAITSRTTDIARFASSITLSGANSSLSFQLDNDVDMTLATPLTLSGGYISTSQLPATSDCAVPSPRKVTLTGAITATQAVDVTMYNNASLTLSGAVTGADFINVKTGTPAAPTLTIGTTTKKSALLTTTYSVSDSLANPSLGENNLAIVNSGVTIANIGIYGGTLKGAGTVGTITMSTGIVAPGLSPGCLTSGNLIYIGGTLEIEINGATVCTQYDQQIVNGTVALGTATALSITRLASYVPALNASYTIINNDAADAVTGTFTGLAQGATTVVNGVTYTISYTGGDGNDVVLTVTGVAASVGAPATGFSLLKSNIALPVLAIISSVAIFGIQKFAFKKSK